MSEVTQVQPTDTTRRSIDRMRGLLETLDRMANEHKYIVEQSTVNPGGLALDQAELARSMKRMNRYNDDVCVAHKGIEAGGSYDWLDIELKSQARGLRRYAETLTERSKAAISRSIAKELGLDEIAEPGK